MNAVQRTILVIGGAMLVLAAVNAELMVASVLAFLSGIAMLWFGASKRGKNIP